MASQLTSRNIRFKGVNPVCHDIERSADRNGSENILTHSLEFLGEGGMAGSERC